MKLNTTKKEYKVTVTNGVEEAHFYGHPLTPKEMTQLLKTSTEKHWEKNQRFEELNIYKYKLSKIQRIVQRWEGIEDENGKPLECTEGNKELVYLYNSPVIDNALEQFDDIGSTIQHEKEYLEKNSLNGSAGSSVPTE